jgi:hypothetical protein
MTLINIEESKVKKNLTKSLVLLLVGGLAINICAEEAVAKNLLKHDFSKLNAKGIPVGYKFYPGKKKEGKITVTQEDGANIIKLELPKQGRIFLDSAFLMDIKKNKKYVITVQLKIENQKYSGKGMHFFYVCAYNTSNNKHIYNKIMGRGSSGGWMTVVLAIDTIKRPLLANGKLFLRGYGVSGTYWVKKPMLIELPDDVKLKSHYILENNKTVPGGLLRLETLKKLK